MTQIQHEYSESADDGMVTALAAFLRRLGQGDVSVTFVDGVASLGGQVGSHTARTALEDLVAGHAGVQAVVNELVVEPAAVAHMRPPG